MSKTNACSPAEVQHASRRMRMDSHTNSLQSKADDMVFLAVCEGVQKLMVNGLSNQAALCS